MPGQAISPSQFILSYGVGALVETRDGPNVILDFQNWGQMFTYRGGTKSLNDFAITDDHVTALLNGGRIFRIPTNADLEEPEEEVIFHTGLFPRWAKCERHKCLYELSPGGISNCPKCPPGKFAQTEAIRFIRACPDGHMDDIDWQRIIHRKNRNCDSKHFEWIEAASGDLRSVKIRCLEKGCNAEASLWDIYNQTSRCSGYSPETDTTEKCTKDAIVILKSASNLRQPENVSALTIPPKCTNLHYVLSMPVVLTIVAMNPSIDKNGLLSALKQVAASQPDLIPPDTIDTIEEHDDDEVKSAITDIRTPVDPKLNMASLKEKEFEALKYASVHGHPLTPKRPEDFEVEKGSSVDLTISSKLRVRVTPVKRLRIVIAQRGFRRYVRPKSIPVEQFSPELIEKSYFDGHNRWYPGIAIRGEGIFVHIPSDGHLHLDELSAQAWNREFVHYGRNITFHPVFIFWHTFAHRIIQALGLDSGYSSASIRERIYVKPDSKGTSGEGGFLLYTSQTGGDGSLGGLIALTNHFDLVLDSAFRNVNACSNDPLCEDQAITRGRANGAACYACLFLSETSCDHRNLFLDRNLLRRSI